MQLQIISSTLPTTLVHLIRRIIHALSTLSIASSTSQSSKSEGGADISQPNPNNERTKNREQQRQQPQNDPNSPLNILLTNPTLFSPLRAPRLPIILCHGLYGFDIRGPSSFPKLQVHYWAGVLDVLRKKVGAEVIVTGVSGTGSIEERAAQMDRYLQNKIHGKEVNFIGHSMGGLDCRHLISTINPSARSAESKDKPYYPKSLTTLSTPHRGSQFMDWCLANIGIGAPRRRQLAREGGNNNEDSTQKPPVNSSKTTPETMQKDSEENVLNPSSSPSGGKTKPFPKLPFTLEKPLFSPPPPTLPYPLPLFSTETYTPRSFSLPTLLLSLIDSPAYSNLTTDFLAEFNKRTPNDPSVKYFSVASRKGRSKMGFWHPLWLPKIILDNVEEKIEQEGVNMMGNDGLVMVSSAKWGEFLGIVDNCDHWEIRGAGGLSNVTISSSLGDALNLNNLNLSGVMSWAEWKKKEEKKDDQRNDAPKDMEKEKQDAREVKALTDRLSAVVDWIIDREGTKKPNNVDLNRKNEYSSLERSPSKNMPLPKWDLERFYVALCRKLYDEGL